VLWRALWQGDADTRSPRSPTAQKEDEIETEAVAEEGTDNSAGRMGSRVLSLAAIAGTFVLIVGLLYFAYGSANLRNGCAGGSDGEAPPRLLRCSRSRRTGIQENLVREIAKQDSTSRI